MEAPKYLFAKKIGQLLQMTREGVVDVNYEKSYNPENNKVFEEYVVVEYEGGHTRRVNVTFDSNLGMLRDVLKAI